MARLELAGDVRVAFSHCAAYGVAAIAKEALGDRVTISWTQSLAARPVIDGPRVDRRSVARAVQDHARRHAEHGDWTGLTVGGADSPGLFSPRAKAPGNDGNWRALFQRRDAAVDALVRATRWLDLRMIGALGQPAYWRWDRTGARLPDEGASRWEMKTRNRGEDFVRDRLRPLACAVSGWSADLIEASLAGARVDDAVGRNDAASRTATGLAAPGPADNVLAWCALWGLSLMPVVHSLMRRSASAGSRQFLSGGRRSEWFYLPVPIRPLTVERLMTVLGSRALAEFAEVSVSDQPSDGLGGERAREWLREQGVGGIVVFPVGIFGSPSAPERRAMLGRLVPMLE